MDMARTSVNVAGNCLATVVVAIWEKQFFPGVPMADRSPVAIHGAHAVPGSPENTEIPPVD